MYQLGCSSLVILNLAPVLYVLPTVCIHMFIEMNEKPKLPAVDISLLIANVKPIDNDDEFVHGYSKKVVLIVHTTNDREYLACLTLMKPPTKRDSCVRFTKEECYEFTLGTFGGYSAALVKTKQGEECLPHINAAISQFPNAQAIIGVGVACAKGKKDADDVPKFGDVLVSDRIVEMTNVKGSHDKLINRGSTTLIADHLQHKFCHNKSMFHFQCTEGQTPRNAKVYSGGIISWNQLLNNQITIQKVWENAPEAIGYEMEGCELMKIVREQDKEGRKMGAIIIKGVSDCGDGTKGGDWQLTAALAAAEYANLRLKEHPYAFQIGKCNSVIDPFHHLTPSPVPPITTTCTTSHHH